MFNQRRYPIDAYEANELSNVNLRGVFRVIDRRIVQAATAGNKTVMVRLSPTAQGWWDDIIKAYSIRSFTVAREGDYLKLGWEVLP